MNEKKILVGCISLIIRGKDTLDFERLKKLDFGDFFAARKGTKWLDGEYITDRDGYSEKGVKFKVYNCDEFSNVLESYINTLVPYKEIIREFSAEYEAIIRLFLDTTMQNAVSLVPLKCLEEIVYMGLSLEISIWG